MQYRSGLTKDFLRLYKSAFSRHDRTPVSILRTVGTSLTGYVEGTPVTILHILESQDLVYVQYIATAKKERGKGYARTMLDSLSSKGKPVILGIEDMDLVPFYKACGFVLTGWIHADPDGTNHILSRGDFNPDAYQALWKTLQKDWPLRLYKDV